MIYIWHAILGVTIGAIYGGGLYPFWKWYMEVKVPILLSALLTITWPVWILSITVTKLVKLILE